VLNIGSVSLESTSFAMSALGGGGGTMSTTSNVAPKLIAELNELCMAGKMHEAQKLAIEIDELKGDHTKGKIKYA
jgi:dihydrodipicolinate synthase/N-acetylneuraminate lyase